MDLILDRADELVFDPLYKSLLPDWHRDHVGRQFLSLYAIILVGVATLYFLFATFSYYFIFDHRMMKHPRFLKNQVRLEIEASLKTFMPLDLLTTPWFVLEVRGHSRLYESVGDIKGLSLRPVLRTLAPLAPSGWRQALVESDLHVGGGWSYLVLSSLFFIWFTDLAIYFVHRYEHHPLIYKRIHKPHHRWIIPTPFASHAFHPLDGYAQSLPYHIFVFLFPLQKYLYMGLFVFVNLWSILIHDSEMITDHPLEHVINGPSHHTLHHIYFTCNYGQYLTWADRVGGSYRHPVKGEDPLNVILAAKEKKDREAAEAEARTVLAAALTASLPAPPIISPSPSPSASHLASSTSPTDVPSPDLLSAPRLSRSTLSRSSSGSGSEAEAEAEAEAETGDEGRSLAGGSGRSSPHSLLFSPVGSELESGGTSPAWSDEDDEEREKKEGRDGRRRSGEGPRWGVWDPTTAEGQQEGLRQRKPVAAAVVVG